MTIVSRSNVKTSMEPPRVLATNITVPSISSRNSTLLFMPDRILVMSGKRFSDVPYSSLTIRANPLRFTESGRVPRDSQQVDTTWQYVNVRGGPDRRFKDNPQYPVMLYGELDVNSSGGLHWQLQGSQPAAIDRFGGALRGAPAQILVSQES
jgi:hypothetical protein